ncbi:MAG: UDP-N-acetylmuramate dehydrogenase, partial [bacterium]
NVGAYGQEISDSLLSLEAYDLKQDRFVTLSNEECHFGYRTSIFRGKDWGRYIITSITVKLSKELPQPPFYQAIENVLQKEGISTYTSALIREIVLRIRDSKLPDPACIPNSGSFFKNAIVSQSQFDHISTLESHVPHYQIDASTYKIPTGWLIDKSGLKGSILHGIKVHDQNALILTNIAANSYHNLALAREEIIDIVHQKFGITIEQEVLEIR